MVSASAAIARLTKGSWSPAICASAQSWSAAAGNGAVGASISSGAWSEGAGSARHVRVSGSNAPRRASTRRVLPR